MRISFVQECFFFLFLNPGSSVCGGKMEVWDVSALVFWAGAARISEVKESGAVSEQPTSTAPKGGREGGTEIICIYTAYPGN